MAATATALAQRDRLWGRDIWLDVTAQGADTVTTSAGDLALVEERACLRQAVIRRIITAPGDWAALPRYGVGARRWVKRRNSRASRDELVERIRSQLRAEPRIVSVATIAVEVTEDGNGLKINVVIIPRGRVRPDETLAIGLEVR